MEEPIWVIASPREEARFLSSELDIPLPIAQILVNRKIHKPDVAHKFLFGTWDELYDPFLMKGMKEAVERIQRAIFEKERILIFGDYDVDGVLSVVMLFKALESLGGDVSYFIPARLKEGYGIKEEHLEVVLQNKACLVISVDCGIKAVEFVQKAKELGVDVIITDHHLPGPRLPEALAILNPALKDSGYPENNLAGVGVVFKLVQALFNKEQRVPNLRHFMKLVSIGTISDIADLRGENRLFVKYGLKELEDVSNLGLKSLLDVCGLRSKKISEGDVGFRIGPRINAAGRMATADLAVRLFFSSSLEETAELAQNLDLLNSRRQMTEERILNQALDRIKKKSLHKSYRILIMGCEEWHRGVIGIVASRLKDFFLRPVILFSYEDGQAYGSGRSISEFSLIDCLNECQEYLLTYGGHPLAVGCSLRRDRMNAFKQAINELASLHLSDDLMKRKIIIDTKIDFNEVNFHFLDNFSLLYPFGVGNPKPVFMTEKAEVVSQPQCLQGKHAKLLLRQKGRTFEAMGWEKGDWSQALRKGDLISIAYSFQFSSYLGEEKLTLSLEGLRK